MEFGERLKIAMEFRHKKAVDIVENCGIQKGNLSRYINGKLPEPKQSTIYKIADYLEINRAFLLGISDNLIVWDIEKGKVSETEEEIILADINNICSKQDIETLKNIYNVVKALAK